MSRKKNAAWTTVSQTRGRLFHRAHGRLFHRARGRLFHRTGGWGGGEQGVERDLSELDDLSLELFSTVVSVEAVFVNTISVNTVFVAVFLQ